MILQKHPPLDDTPSRGDQVNTYQICACSDVILGRIVARHDCFEFCDDVERRDGDAIVRTTHQVNGTLDVVWGLRVRWELLPTAHVNTNIKDTAMIGVL